jgi:hypothetical protein
MKWKQIPMEEMNIQQRNYDIETYFEGPKAIKL